MFTMDSLSGLSYKKVNNYYRAVVYDQTQLGHAKARLQVVKVPAGETVEEHYHRERTEVFVVLQGSGQVYINGSPVADKPHDIALCRPNDRHKIVNAGDTDMLIGVFALGYDLEDSFTYKERQGFK